MHHLLKTTLTLLIGSTLWTTTTLAADISPTQQAKDVSQVPTYSHKYNAQDYLPFSNVPMPTPSIAKDAIYFSRNSADFKAHSVNKNQTIDAITRLNPWFTKYQFNGISYSLKSNWLGLGKNAKPITLLSNTLTYKDYQTISNLKRYADVDFYDMASQKNLLVLKQDGKLTQKQRQKLKRYAYAYRPKITFNQKINHQHYTTLMQPQYRAVSGAGNQVYLDGNWSGYTFVDGKQIQLEDVLKQPYSFELDNYIRQMISQNAIDVDGAFASGQPKSYYSDYAKGISAFFITDNGVYVIYTPMVDGYVPYAVKIPSVFLKPAFQKLF